jgi:hypothetical protein
VFTVRLCLPDDFIFKHEWRYAFGTGCRYAVKEFGNVYLCLDNAKRGGNLSGIVIGEHAFQGTYVQGGCIGIRRNGNHRNRQLPQSLNKPPHLRCQPDPAGQYDAGDVGIRIRRISKEAGKDNV